MNQLEVHFGSPLRLVVEMAQPKSPGIRGVFTTEIGNLKFTGENMSSTMQNGTLATVSVQWKDQDGNPAKVDGPTTWQSTDTSVLTVTVSTGNPLIANEKAVNIGKAQVHANADADMGSGVRPVTCSYDIEVISGEAVGGEITFTQSPPQTNPPKAK